MVYIYIVVAIILSWFLLKRYGMLGGILLTCCGAYILSSDEYSQIAMNLFNQAKRGIVGISDPNAAKTALAQISVKVKEKKEALTHLSDMVKQKGANIKVLNKIKDVIDHKKNPNTKDEALLKAAANGNVAEVESLLKEQADINAQDEYGRTPLILATINYKWQMIQTLIKHQADSDIKDNNKQTALMLATLLGYMKTFELLASDPNASRRNKGEALILAASLGRTEMSRILIENQAHINQKDDKGQTALIHATINGYTRITEMLINHSANPDVTDNNGHTALMIAKQRKRTKIIELLEKIGAK